MTNAAWPKTLEIPVGARRQWASLRVALAAGEPPCASDPDLWHSRSQSDIEAASDACLTCHALAACDDYAVAANEVVGVWAGVDRYPGSNRSARGAGS